MNGMLRASRRTLKILIASDVSLGFRSSVGTHTEFEENTHLSQNGSCTLLIRLL